MQAVEHFITQFVPEHYDLFLDSWSWDQDLFLGSRPLLVKHSDRISFTKKMEITSVEAAGRFVHFYADHDNEALSYELAEAGQAAEITQYRFFRKITDNMTGFTLLTTQWMVSRSEVLSTQFESHFAREAFPCVDEPEAKVNFWPFSLRFDQAEGEVALSNMPEITWKTVRNRRLKFETTLHTFLLVSISRWFLQGATS